MFQNGIHAGTNALFGKKELFFQIDKPHGFLSVCQFCLQGLCVGLPTVWKNLVATCHKLVIRAEKQGCA